jgi:hypothetical protein
MSLENSSLEMLKKFALGSLEICINTVHKMVHLKIIHKY